MIGEHIRAGWARLTFKKKSDWRQVVTEQPWLYSPYAVVGQSGGSGSTRSRWTSYDVYKDGSLIASRPRVKDGKAAAERVAGAPISWSQETLEAEEVMTNLHGLTKEFSGPTRWYSGE